MVKAAVAREVAMVVAEKAAVARALVMLVELGCSASSVSPSRRSSSLLPADLSTVRCFGWVITPAVCKVLLRHSCICWRVFHIQIFRPCLVKRVFSR